jgi:NADPH:quinone reductase-like Zn-dependent oxidoreductase
MSRIVEFASFGAPEVLKFKDVPDSQPAAGEVRIRVKAIGLNRAESMWRHDEYIERANLPARLGYEAAGTVDALGKGVEGFEIGEPVNVIPNFSMNEYATYGELIVMPVGSIVKQPASLSFVEGASIWMMFVTAYSALIEDAKVSKGDFVIIPAASSSVGLAAIQIVNYAGATSIALTRRSNKRKQLLEAGAAQVIATEEVDFVQDEEVDFVQEMMRLTDGKGARVAFDPVGGPNFPKLLSALAFQGILYIYGALSENVTPLPALEMIAKMATVKGHNIWLTSGNPDKLKTAVVFIRRGFDEAKLKPVIDRIFRFDEIVEAHRYLEGGEQIGKIVATL